MSSLNFAVAQLLSAAVVGVIALSLAPVALAQDGPASALAPPAVADPPRAAPAPAYAAVPADEALRLDEYLNRLDEWRVQGRITAEQSTRARRLLNAAVVGRDRSVHIPLDASGRIDLLTLARGKADAAGASMRPSDRLTSRVVNEFDLRMRVKARDMANPANLVMFDAAPGYMHVPTRDLSRIVKDTFESTPLGELPGGSHLLTTIDALPNVSGAKSDHTVREISRLVGDRQEDWLNGTSVGRFVARHRLTAGLAAFGAITGLRMSNAQTARTIDRFGLRLRLRGPSTRDGRLYSTGRLIYRNGYVLPELELESGLRHAAGPMTLHVSGAGTIAAEGAHHARGRMAIGARWTRGPWFSDTTAMYAFVDRLARTELRGGYLTDTGFAVSAALAATFGRYSGAVGAAAGRLSYELDLTKSVLLGDARGETGLFVSTSADSDFSHTDGRAGLVFRLRF